VTNQLLNDRYQIINNLGSGGFGETFLAEDTQMPSRRRCVVKKLRPTQNDPALSQLIQERFQREAAILETLSSGSRQIPQLYAYFYSEKDQQFYIVQEWIEGNTLDTLLPANSQMGEASVRKILTDILPVFSYIHSKSIVHRDIKPDNIILRHSDKLPVLIDFGAVREVMNTVMNSQGQPAQSIVVGTPGYMPSEQLIGRPVYNSDLYSLGLTAIFLLTGKHPSELPSDQSNAKLLWHSQAPQVSPALAQVLDKAISYHYGDRYQNADEFLAALQSGASTSTPAPTTAINANHVMSTVQVEAATGRSAPTKVIGNNVANQVMSPVNPVVAVPQNPIDIKKMLVIGGAIVTAIAGGAIAMAVFLYAFNSGNSSSNVNSSSTPSADSSREDTTQPSIPQVSTIAQPADKVAECNSVMKTVNEYAAISKEFTAAASGIKDRAKAVETFTELGSKVSELSDELKDLEVKDEKLKSLQNSFESLYESTAKTFTNAGSALQKKDAAALKKSVQEMKSIHTKKASLLSKINGYCKGT
jgi:serine/threonine protein kinase, bacterial